MTDGACLSLTFFTINAACSLQAATLNETMTKFKEENGCHARLFTEGDGVHAAHRSWTLDESSTHLMCTVIPALMKGLGCQGHSCSVISDTVIIDNVQYFISRGENKSTDNWRTFPAMLCS